MNIETTKSSRLHQAPHQRGAVLFFALILLIVISLLAITSSSTALLQEKMTASLRDQQLSLMAGETALRAAEARLWAAAGTGSPILTCHVGSGAAAFGVRCFDSRRDPAVEQFRNSTLAANFVSDASSGESLLAASQVDLTAPATAADATSRVSASPYFLIEDLGGDLPPNVGDNREYRANPVYSGSEKHIYRITARSLGNTDSILRIVQSTFVTQPK